MMMRFVHVLSFGYLVAMSWAAGCSASSGGHEFGNSGGAGGAGAGAVTGNGATTTTSSSTNSGLGGGFVTVAAGSGTGGGPSCSNPPDTDGDGDGVTGAQGDCNDCDANVGPGSIEVINPDPMAPISDEDCDGTADNVAPTCDDNLLLTDVDPMHAAWAIDLCQATTATDYTWGVLSSSWVRSNGVPAAMPSKHVGIFNNFGPNVNVQRGMNMLSISSGFARRPADPDPCLMSSCTEYGVGTPPPGFPQDPPNCPISLSIYDDVALELRVRSPRNATGYEFLFRFYSFEYPEWVCQDYNDQFIALVAPPPAGSINGNISFDSQNNPVSVNVAFFEVCQGCPLGTNDLTGTGFDTWNDAGATGWLKTQAPVTGGDELTIRLAIWDTGDAAYDSTALVDGFNWIANGGTITVGTEPIPNPH
jgi:hypothetical protein